MALADQLKGFGLAEGAGILLVILAHREDIDRHDAAIGQPGRGEAKRG